MLIAISAVNELALSYFNTSHVNVNQYANWKAGHIIGHFNTSHVNVNHYGIIICKTKKQISIHLMLMLIIMLSGKRERSRHFNTSHVNVNPTNLSLFNHA